MNGYRLHCIKFEMQFLSDWCDDWLQAAQYKIELRFVSDWCDEWLQAGKYKV